MYCQITQLEKRRREGTISEGERQARVKGEKEGREGGHLGTVVHTCNTSTEGAGLEHLHFKANQAME